MIDPACCSTPITLVTRGRVAPSMIARNSCFNRNSSAPTRSWVCSSHRQQRCFEAVQRVAGGALHQLQHVRLRIAADRRPERAELGDELQEAADRHLWQRAIRHLHESIGRRPSMSPRNTLTPSIPSKPTVATSTRAPSRISFVTE